MASRTLARSIAPYIKEDLENKIVLLSGPRQVGKTFLSQTFYLEKSVYLNYDNEDLRRIVLDRSWDRKSEIVIFDELHKKKGWKKWIKGIYDVEKVRPRLLMTGSARLDVYRRGGDSLAGRHFSYRLHPLSVKEAGGPNPEETLDQLLMLGGFPEPLLKGSEAWAKRWRRSHLDRILREDLLDLEKVRELKSMEVLVQLLSERVGSPISYASLARDLEVSPHTAKKWIQILENLFVIFIVIPYSKNLAKSLLKEPKIYFYDTGRVRGPLEMRYENIVACSLIKRLHFLEDTRGESCQLHYLRDREKREVDFACLINDEVESLVEAKWANPNLNTSLEYYAKRLKPARAVQLVKELRHEEEKAGVEIRNAARWLNGLET